MNFHAENYTFLLVFKIQLRVVCSVRLNVRFGSVSSAEPLVRSGSVVRQNHWFGEPNR